MGNSNKEIKNLNNQKYKKMVEKASPPSSFTKNLINAFIFGGLFCILAQAFNDTITQYSKMNGGQQIDTETASGYTTLFMVALGAILTMFNVYDKIGKVAGAGSIVPITGFANSIVSPAMEFRSEGHILGMGVQMFIVAGPVLVFGTSAAIIAGLIYYLINLV